MFICEIWLFHWYCPQFCKSDMSKHGYLEVFQRSLRLRDNERRLYIHISSEKATNSYVLTKEYFLLLFGTVS